MPKNLLKNSIKALCIATTALLFSCNQAKPSVVNQNYGKTVPSYLEYELSGKIITSNGTPAKGLRFFAKTDLGTSSAKTDSNGNYRCKIKQNPNESILFIFKNAIGDTVYFRHQFELNQNKILNFTISQKGSIKILK